MKLKWAMLLLALLILLTVLAALPVKADVPRLRGENVKVLCGYGDSRYPKGWTTRYHRDPADLLPVFVEILDEIGANKLAAGAPLYKGTYIMRFTVETHEGASESNRLDVGRGNRTGGTRKPVTATIRVVVRQIIDNNGTESVALAQGTGEATAFSGNVRTDLSFGKFQGRPFRTSSETRVSTKEAEYAAIAAALKEAASGLLRPVPVHISPNTSQRDAYDYYRSTPQPQAEETEEDVLVAPLPRRMPPPSP